MTSFKDLLVPTQIVFSGLVSLVCVHVHQSSCARCMALLGLVPT